MKIGLIGLNQTGKTTLYNLLTGKSGSSAHSRGKGVSAIGSCSVPDSRVDFLSALYNPKKTTYAKIELTDVAGFSPSSPNQTSGASRFLNDVRACDAIVQVVRAFQSSEVVHELDTIDPFRDLEAVETEMLFADLEVIERRISKIKSGKKITHENEQELTLMTRCYNHLESGSPLSDLQLTADEQLSIRGLSFLTEKPRLVVVNVDEDQYREDFYPAKDALYAHCKKQNLTLIPLCAEMELEISLLSQEDQKLFMDELGIETPGISVLANSIYSQLGLISFLTYGEDEVRAWTIEDGTIAKKAAGKIHTDIERGFIRAEVVAYDDLQRYGSMAAVREKGLFRLEGKEYLVKDGDVITFRFNV